MKLTFSKSATIKDVNSIFRQKYPCLKLKLLHPVIASTDVAIMATDDLTFRSVYADMNEATIEITDNQTALQLESDVLQRTSLKIKLFRRKDHYWILAESHKNLTLNELNRMGTESGHCVP